LSIGQGQCFSCALPPGWQVGEDGAYALTLVAPDRKALTLMVGNAGLPGYVMPGQYVWQTLMAIQPMGLQFSPPRPAQPVAGFQSAQEFDVSYFIQGVPCQGIARCHVAPGYDAVTMAVPPHCPKLHNGRPMPHGCPRWRSRFRQRMARPLDAVG